MPDADDRREFIAAIETLAHATDSFSRALHEMGSILRDNTLEVRRLNDIRHSQNELEKERVALEREGLHLQSLTLERNHALDARKVERDITDSHRRHEEVVEHIKERGRFWARLVELWAKVVETLGKPLTTRDGIILLGVGLVGVLVIGAAKLLGPDDTLALASGLVALFKGVWK